MDNTTNIFTRSYKFDPLLTAPSTRDARRTISEARRKRLLPKPYREPVRLLTQTFVDADLLWDFDRDKINAVRWNLLRDL